jgi:hypothetical protein
LFCAADMLAGLKWFIGFTRLKADKGKCIVIKINYSKLSIVL